MTRLDAIADVESRILRIKELIRAIKADFDFNQKDQESLNAWENTLTWHEGLLEALKEGGRNNAN